MVLLKSRLLILTVSGLLTATPTGGQATAPVNQSRTEASSAEVQLLVEVAKDVDLARENPSFKISFRNAGNKNLLLNGGQLLGNGAELWSAIKCDLRTKDERLLPLSMSWGVSGIAGAAYFLGLPLRAGSSYTILVTSKDYYVGKGDRHLDVGVYGLTCTFSGSQSNNRDRTQLPPCWEGLTTSNTARVEVTRAK